MGPDVGRQVGRLTEGFVAVAATVGPLPGMRSHVGLERAGPGVSLPADSAQIGLHPSATAASSAAAGSAGLHLNPVVIDGR